MTTPALNSIRGLPGACYAGAAACTSLWQMTESGSPTTDLPAETGTRPSKIVCSAIT